MFKANIKNNEFIKVFGFLLISILLAAISIFLANINHASAEAICSEGNAIISSEYLDFVDIGDVSSEEGHVLLGWSEPNIDETMADCDPEAGCNYRQAWDPVCNSGNKAATISFDVPEGFYASSLDIRHFDGSSDFDSFKLYVNNVLALEYKDSGTEVNEPAWLEKSADINNLSGVVIVRIEATSLIRSGCNVYGQMPVDWIGIKGYTCENGSISGCSYRDSDGFGTITEVSEKLSDWEIIIETCGEMVLNSDGVYEFQFNLNDECTPLANTTTDALGCYIFPNLPDGQYRVSETLKAGWTQTMPEGMDYNIGLNGGDHVENINFANFQGYTEVVPSSICGNEIVEYYEECDGQSDMNEGFYCSDTCTIETIVEEAENTPIPEEIADVGGNDEEVVVLGEAGAPNLSIGKIILNQKANNSELIEEKVFKIIITNNGNLPAFAVNVVDNLPEGLVFSGTEDTSKEWFLDDIAPGQIRNITYLVDILDTATPGIYTNVATAFASNHSPIEATADIIVGDIPVVEAIEETAAGTAPKIIPEDETEVLGEVGTPELIITKTADRSIVNMGSGLVEYTIIITNNGNIAAFSATLVDTLYGGMLHSDTGEAIKTWNLGNIEPGEAKTIKYTVDVGTVDVFGEHANTAVVFASNHSPVSASSVIDVKEGTIAAPVGGGEIMLDADAKLPETGFSNTEFIVMLGVLSVLAGAAAVLRKKYLA